MAWNVFHDLRFDFRLLIVGALLPDLIDMPFGRALYGHSAVCAVGLLVVAMLATIGKRLRRKHALAIVIGIFFHLVLDGAWNTSRIFWYPLTGLYPNESSIPLLQRSGVLNVVLEVVGLAACAWFIHKFDILENKKRSQFLRTGSVSENIAA